MDVNPYESPRDLCDPPSELGSTHQPSATLFAACLAVLLGSVGVLILLAAIVGY